MKSIWSVSFRAITLLAAMGGAAALAAENPDANAERHVMVCMEGNEGAASLQARALASHMFAVIGVTIDWRVGLRGCPSHGIRVILSTGTPANFEPHALAYARPYEGTYIRVLYDRIAGVHRRLRLRTCWRTSWYTRSRTFCKVLTGTPRAAL